MIGVTTMRRVLVLMLGAGLVLAACGGSSHTTDSRAVTTTSGASTTTSASTTTTTAPKNAIGVPYSSYGITIVVDRVSRTDMLKYERAVNDHHVGEPVPAGPGAEYVVVQTRVANNSKGPIDLTCSLPVTMHLVNMSGQQFAPIEDLAWVLPNNPECNAQTNPGFTVPMTWAFKVPASIPIAGVQFHDSTDVNNVGAPDITIPLTG